MRIKYKQIFIEELERTLRQYNSKDFTKDPFLIVLLHICKNFENDLKVKRLFREKIEEYFDSINEELQGKDKGVLRNNLKFLLNLKKILLDEDLTIKDLQTIYNIKPDKPFCKIIIKSLPEHLSDDYKLIGELEIKLREFIISFLKDKWNVNSDSKIWERLCNNRERLFSDNKFSQYEENWKERGKIEEVLDFLGWIDVLKFILENWGCQFPKGLQESLRKMVGEKGILRRVNKCRNLIMHFVRSLYQEEREIIMQALKSWEDFKEKWDKYKSKMKK